MDFAITKHMLKVDKRKPEEVAEAIREASPNIESRKAGHIKDYAERTVRAAQKSIALEEAASLARGRGWRHGRGGPSLG